MFLFAFPHPSPNGTSVLADSTWAQIHHSQLVEA
jgi:hypothetical protein